MCKIFSWQVFPHARFDAVVLEYGDSSDFFLYPSLIRTNFFLKLLSFVFLKKISGWKNQGGLTVIRFENFDVIEINPVGICQWN